MIKITAFGAAKEIGKSAILVEDKDTKILLDCGLKIRPKEPTEAPLGLKKHAKEIQSMVISHAHFDHTGYIPRMVQEGCKNVHMTHPTKDIAAVLWRDHLKIEGARHWNEDDMYDTLRTIKSHYYDQKFKLADGVTATYYDAGHILGSASILLDWKGQLIFYTGDINTFATPYHDTNKYPTIEDISILISESTNGLRDLPNREIPNESIVEAIYKTYQRGGITIIPTFALGRAQEIEAILAKEFLNKEFRIFVDGMILKMNEIYRMYFHEYWVSKKILEWCRDRKIEVPFDLKNFIPVSRNLADNLNTYRKMIVTEKKPNIILSTSGMMEGGPIHSYLNHAAGNPKNLIAISGYQVEETIGRQILEGAKSVTLFRWGDKKGFKTEIKTEVKQFQFSGHAQRNELIKMIKAINSENVLLVHGSEESGESLKKDLENGREVKLPTVREPIEYEN
ncbi:MAG: MBL fold metallo-hydrolase [Candidatus Heimdallarchaeota archaeon]|nr:MBL fold metallo-hydrolase [Candidatus Heimdallarchaeota archaeon]